jgi:hypothetical protein
MTAPFRAGAAVGLQSYYIGRVLAIWPVTGVQALRGDLLRGDLLRGGHN